MKMPKQKVRGITFYVIILTETNGYLKQRVITVVAGILRVFA